MANPYRFPAQPHVRRHGPAGYAEHGAFRPWLRDEFDFRCVYCLHREGWSNLKGSYDIDHFSAQSRDPGNALNYDNLFYACHGCNLTKSAKALPDPHRVAYGRSLMVETRGTMRALDDHGELLIELLDLNEPERVEFRKYILDTVKLASEQNAITVLDRLLGVPMECPNLAKMRPPGGNTRPEGMKSSWCQRVVDAGRRLYYE